METKKQLEHLEQEIFSLELEIKKLEKRRSFDPRIRGKIQILKEELESKEKEKENILELDEK